MSVKPWSSWTRSKPPVPQSGTQVPYWSADSLEQAAAFADAFPAVQSTVQLPPNPLPKG